MKFMTLVMAAIALGSAVQLCIAGGNIATITVDGINHGVFAPPYDLGIVKDVAAIGVRQTDQHQVIGLRNDGTIKSWGPIGSHTPRDLGSVTSIHATYFRFYSVSTTGAVRSWATGELESQPFEPEGLGLVSKVSGFYRIAIALRTDGSVWWSPATVNHGVYHDIPPRLHGCTDVATGSEDSVGLALRADGVVVWWGSEEMDCGFPPSSDCAVPMLPRHTDQSPSEISFGSPVTFLADAQYGAALLTANGEPMIYGREGQRWGTNGDFSPVCGDFVHIDMTPDQPFYGDFRGARVGGDFQDKNFSRACDGPQFMPEGVVTAVFGSRRAGVIFAMYQPYADQDSDGIGDQDDNCTTVSNPNQADCNDDGIGDACDIAAGESDFNHDGITDSCQCLGDINADGRTDGGDLGAVLAYWGPVTASSMSQACDIDGSGAVTGADLGIVLANWGTCAQATNASAPSWATLVEGLPDPAVVISQQLREAIRATGLAWRVRDKSTNIEMVLVPPGMFTMGCSASNSGSCNSNENPTHSVTMTQAYYMGRYEVTQAQWAAVMGSNPSYFQSHSDSANYPVEQVSWSGVQKFLTATGMRLPSEAEWEFACRAGTTTAYANGSDTFSWAVGWSGAYSSGSTHAITEGFRNGFGLDNMLGNVGEQVQDWYGEYSASPQVSPGGPISGEYHVVRGGSCGSSANDIRCSSRSYCDPGFTSKYTGFRVAKNP